MRPSLLITLCISAMVVTGCSTTSSRTAPIEDRIPKVTPTVPRGAIAKASAMPKSIPAPDAPRAYAVPDAAPVARIPTPPTSSASPPSPAAPLLAPTDPAVQELLAKSEHAAATGDQATARAILERAVKVKPDDGRVWYQLAALDYAARDYEQAIVIAQRARSLAHGEQALIAHVDELIQAAQRKLKRGG